MLKRSCGALMAALALMIPSAASAADTTATARQSLLSFLDAQLTLRANRSSLTDPLYFERGLWQTTNTACWACNNGGPATTAATVWRATLRSRTDLLAQATQTIDTAIAQRQASNGLFVPPLGDGQYASPGVASVVFSLELGTTYLLLEPALNPDTKARWRQSLAAAAAYLITNGDVYWYANGNVALGNAELLYLAWRITADAKFKTAYDNAFTFLLAPPQNKWPGRGLRIVTQPTRADGADGAGYLTETGPGGTGFDPEYTMLQLEIATRLYLLSGDPRALRLTNLMTNMLLPRVGTDYLLDASNGTRHTQTNRRVPFMTPAFAALSWIAGRTDLQRHLLPHLTAAQTQYTQPWNLTNEVLLRGLGNDLSTIIMAADRDTNVISPTLAMSSVAKKAPALRGVVLTKGARPARVLSLTRDLRLGFRIDRGARLTAAWRQQACDRRHRCTWVWRRTESFSVSRGGSYNSYILRRRTRAGTLPRGDRYYVYITASNAGGSASVKAAVSVR